MSYISAEMTKYRDKVTIWERTADNQRRSFTVKAPYYFYTINEDNEGQFKDIHGNSLDRHDFEKYKDFKIMRDQFSAMGLQMYEADILPHYKLLSELYHGEAVNELTLTFYDIEVDYSPSRGFAGPDSPYAPISSVALHHYHSGVSKVFVVPPESEKDKTKNSTDLDKDIQESGVQITICEDEKQLLKLLISEFEESDIICGWNSYYYDDPYVYIRAKKVLGNSWANRLSFPDAREPYLYDKEIKKSNYTMYKKTVKLGGRVSLDYLDVFKNFEAENRQSYSLESVSEDVLPELAKLDHGDISLYELYNYHFNEFVRYNIRDTEVLKGFEDKLKYIKLAIDMSHESTGLIPDVLGTVKLAECSIINYCHYDLDVKVPNKSDIIENTGKYKGALVLPPQAGEHEWIASVDIASLYPSGIRTVNISPETLVGQFEDTYEDYNRLIKEDCKENVTLVYEDGNYETKPAKDWNDYLIKNKWAVSGYGTVFDQNNTGIIPTVLANWFKDRKRHKKQRDKALEELDKNKSKYNKQEINKLKEFSDFHDRFQYIKKIQLNSMYGCMGNKFFRFYDVRMAESTTRTGQNILMHMVRKIAELLDGEYIYPSKSTVYSDTDSCYFLTHAKNQKDATTIGLGVEKRVNDSFTPFVRKAFKANEGYDGLISAEAEVVADKSIFVAKKIYLMHLTYKDGFAADKIKIMGHALKKTILPKTIRKGLEHAIGEYLRGNHDWEEYCAEVVKIKDQILSKSEDDIRILGTPKKVNEMEKYTNMYETGDPAFTRTGHHAACILWNLMREKYNDKESIEIKSEMPIMTFYLKEPMGKFKQIAFPVDSLSVPEWFNKEFSPLIDKNEQVTRMIDNSMKNIYNVLDRQIPSKKLLLEYELFE